MMKAIAIKFNNRNPARNWQIDPARNWQINPARNWQINPARNILIDPIRSMNISGNYVCSVQDGNSYYFSVKAERQDVQLIFDGDKNFCFFAVGISGCYILFRVTDQLNIGYLCPNGIGRYNWFSQKGEWLFFLT